VTLTFDLDIQQTFVGLKGTCSCKISSIYVDRFKSYRVDRENSDDAENNTHVASAGSNEENAKL